MRLIDVAFCLLWLPLVTSTNLNIPDGALKQPYDRFSNQSSSSSLAYSPPFYPSPWIGGSFSVSNSWSQAHQKARAFVSQLTLLEKVNLTTGVGWSNEACVGNTGSIPRLGFRSLCLQDSPVGIRFADFNSVFPAGGTVAASWDRQIWHDRGYAMGSEHRDKGVDIQLGPVVGPIGRAPAGGRNWEGFSPDPYLTGIANAESVKGIQDAGVIACTKHFIANEQEHFRQAPEAQGYGFNISESSSSNIDDITMHELYLWPFADAVKAGTAAVMCSYQQINNSYGCQNSYTMNYLLKGELGFQGFIMSDWSAQHTGISSSLAGLDMTMPGDIQFNTGTSFFGSNLTISVLNGTLPEWRLDDMAVRIMTAYYYVGRNGSEPDPNFNSWSRDIYGYKHFYSKAGYGQINYQVDVREEHYRLIRQHAAESTVLLKNVNGTLPLKVNRNITGVFGSDSRDDPRGPNGCADHGCDNGTLAVGWGSGTASFTSQVPPLAALQLEAAASNAPLEWATDDWDMSSIKILAKRIRTALVFVNADSGEGFISVDGNEGDRNNLTLWNNGDMVVEAVAANCANTIVIIHSVGPVTIGSWNNHPNVTAIIWAGLPGEQSGFSITDILYGRVNPSAKLPFTLGAKRQDFGTDVLYEPNNGMGAPQSDFNEGIFIDYRHFDRANITPTYEFGYGLSYTSFSYSNLQITPLNPQPYIPNIAYSTAAETLGSFLNDTSQYTFPPNFTILETYIYPYLNATDLGSNTVDSSYGNNDFIPPKATDGSPQPPIRAGGGPGGNPRLFDDVFEVTATITNTGTVIGDEVVQLYLSLGGPNNAPKVLRGFAKLKNIAPNGSAQFTSRLQRRDLMNWSPQLQDWYVNEYPKTLYVGASSRILHLSLPLPAIPA